MQAWKLQQINFNSNSNVLIIYKFLDSFSFSIHFSNAFNDAEISIINYYYNHFCEM